MDKKFAHSVMGELNTRCRCGVQKHLRDMFYADVPIGPAYLCDECAVGWELAHWLDTQDQQRHTEEHKLFNRLADVAGDLWEDERVGVEVATYTRYPTLTKAMYDYSCQHLGLDPMPGCGPTPCLDVWADVWNKVINDE